MTLDPEALTKSLLDQLRADVTDDHEYQSVLMVVQRTFSERANAIVQANTADLVNRAAKQILAERAIKRGITTAQLADEMGVTAKAMADNAATYLTIVKTPTPAVEAVAVPILKP